MFNKIPQIENFTLDELLLIGSVYHGIDFRSFTELELRNKLLFIKRQQDLLAIVNTELGRFLVDARIDRPVVMVTPSALIYHTGNYIKRLSFDGKSEIEVPELRGQFYLYERQVKILKPVLERIDAYRKFHPSRIPLGSFQQLLEHCTGIHRMPGLPALSFFEETQGFLYLQSNFYVNGGDGVPWTDDATFSTARSAAVGDQGVSMTNMIGEFFNGQYRMGRVFEPVDTSAMGAGALVTAVVHNQQWHTSSYDAAFNDSFTHAITTQASTASCADTDFDNITLNSPTSFGVSANHGTYTATQYYTVTYNADGRAAVVPTSYTKYGFRWTRDVDNTTFNDARCYHNIFLSDTTGTSQDPYFDITYTPSGEFEGVYTKNPASIQQLKFHKKSKVVNY